MLNIKSQVLFCYFAMFSVGFGRWLGLGKQKSVIRVKRIAEFYG